MFTDRIEAGRQLAKKLALYRGKSAVGAHYMRFEQVEDAEVIRLLQSVHEVGSKTGSRN